MITIPTISELYTAILTNLENEFNATINPEGKAELRAEAASRAGLMHLQYLAIAETQKNIFVDTCDEETLIRFGLVKLNRQPFAAVAGQYQVTVTGTIGGVIAANTVFRSSDSALNAGILYILDTQHVMVTNSDTITLRCLTLGIDGKLNVNDTLTSTTPIALVDSIATVSAETIQPLAAETIDAYRAAVINAFRLEAQGGSAGDYRLWASDAQGVLRVYPYAKSNAPSQIDIYIEATIADSTDGKGTPSQQIIDDVEQVVNFDPDTSLPINERGRRPLQVGVNYLPVTPKDVVVTITGYQGLTAAIELELSNAINDAILLIRPFVAAAEPIADENDVLDVNKLIGFIISTKPGAIFTSVSFTVDSVSVSTYKFMLGNIPYFNPTIVFN
jgi:uncharacterized phage protein gp47/JayE